MRRGGTLAAVTLAALAACNKSAPPSPTGTSSATPSAAVKGDAFATGRGDLVVAPIHHATLLFAFDGKAIYLDPTKDGKYDGLPKADYVFITDIHGDHMDPDGLAKVKKADTVVVGPPAVGDKMADVSIRLKNGDSKDFGAFSVLAVPMYNLTRGPSPGALYHDKGRGDGYVFTFGDKRVYVSGDTECTPEMRALQKIDVAFVCMNLPYTMPPSEAAECVKAFQPKVIYPYHYRGSNLDELRAPVEAAHASEVRLREWY